MPLPPLTFHLVDLDEPAFRATFDPLVARWNARLEGADASGSGADARRLEEVPLDACVVPTDDNRSKADETSAAESTGLPLDVLVAGVAKREQLERGPARLIIPWAGVPRSVAALLTEFPGVSVHNLHYNAIPVAEHALALLLAVARRLVPADRLLRAADWSWRFRPTDSPLLAGKRMLVLGAGALAQRIARAGIGLDLAPTLFGTRPRTLELELPGVRLPLTVIGPALLDAALAEADILVVTLPWTPATEAFVDARRLALLPRGAIIINVGRGAVIDEAALFEALRTGHLGGAGLDVWYDYPREEEARKTTPPSRFPFADLDNVVLSPHRAGHGLESDRLCAEHLFQALTRAATGQPIGNDVDPARGY